VLDIDDGTPDRESGTLDDVDHPRGQLARISVGDLEVDERRVAVSAPAEESEGSAVEGVPQVVDGGRA
jgi:hypothetical protein